MLINLNNNVKHMNYHRKPIREGKQLINVDSLVRYGRKKRNRYGNSQRLSIASLFQSVCGDHLCAS